MRGAFNAHLLRYETLADWLDARAAATPDGAAIVSQDGATTSWRELRSRSRQFAAGLRGLAIAPGDVVAAQLPNRAEFLIAYLGCGLCGAVLQTVHMPYRAGEIAGMLRHSGARAAIVMPARRDWNPADTLRALRDDGALPALQRIIVAGDLDGDPGAIPFATLAATRDDGEPAQSRADATFLLLYTSGTSAAPKAVPITPRRFLANARLSAPELGIGPDSRLLCAAPFTHLYGLFGIHLALPTGAATLLLPAFAPPALAAAMAALRPTGLFTAPAHVAACFGAGLLGPADLESLDFAMISVPAAESAPPNLDDMRAWLAAEGIAKLRWPERVEAIAAMPMTPTRKVMKGELRRLAAALPAPQTPD
jgi:cyclohexanecarboxylate-CoA ligase